MRIASLRCVNMSSNLHFEDSKRGVLVVKLNDVVLTGRNIHYPNCLLKEQSTDYLINPYDERVMSLMKNCFYDNDKWDFVPVASQQVAGEYFFFNYNVDNYFHFIYDTLPILYQFYELKKTYPDIKLLIQTSHPTKETFSPFVAEILNILDVPYLLADDCSEYETLFVGTSLTHGGYSNEAPSELAFSVWKRCIGSLSTDGPRKFYISRRSWVHGQTENMGTNYTMRRKCENEDAVVSMLENYGIVEIFTELLSTEEKTALFSKAELVVGIVGGGMCNLLFSPAETKSLCITTPYFMDINNRFRFSMEHTQLNYSDCTKHTGNTKFLLYSRVRVIGDSEHKGKIGEVEGVENGYTVRLSSNDVAGFSQDFPMDVYVFNEEDLEAVDLGLNSPFECDIVQLESDLKKLLE